MALAHRWADRNLSRLELTVAVLTIAILIGGFMGRGLRIFAAAEEVSVRTTLVNVNSALRVLFYRLLVQGREAEAGAWDRANPVALIQAGGTLVDATLLRDNRELARIGAGPPGLISRYLGEFEFIDPATVPGGSWYFDRGERVLVYRVRNTEFFRSPLPGAARLRFRLEQQFDDLNADGQYNSESETISGAALLPVDEYQWIEAGS